jgi:hypothetical protein
MKFSGCTEEIIVGQNSKPIELLQAEGRNHFTKQEIESQRESEIHSETTS